MRRFSELDKHYDRHNEGVCSVCGCTTARWKSVCDSCRDEAVQELIKKEELKKQEEECQAK
jgi:predicted amidophosphoribosyltransferase